jgi:HSP20 family protein
MAEQGSKVPVTSERKSAAPSRGAYPLAPLHQGIDRLFDEFSRGFSLFPFGPRGFDWEPTWRFETGNGGLTPNVDVAETDKAFEITAELPGMTEQNIDVSLSDGVLTLKGEKKEEKEQKEKGYYLSERRYGSFQRSFRLPDGVDENKIEANFEKGVLKITLPKTPEAVKQAKKIAVKAK